MKTLAVAAAAAAVGPRPASAAGAEKLAVTDPSAVALGYVLDAATVDAKKFPSFVKGQTCENCLQLEGTAGNSYRPCTLFPGKLVAASGWCSAWAAEM